MQPDIFVLETFALILSAVVSFMVCYILYRSFEVAFWGYLSAFLPRMPVLFLRATGATNLWAFALLSHTIGIFIFALLLAVADILLLEVALIKVFKPVSFLLPKPLRTVIRLEMFINRLQRYKALPRPIRVKNVFTACMIAGLINLAFSLGFGLL